MMPDATKSEGESLPPVSVFAGPIAELVHHRLLAPPTRPGLLASLARYEVIRVLGGGGMGVVVLARDAESGADVAIKLIRPELVSNQRMVHRFVKEAGHLQKLKHPNVVAVLEVSDRPEGPYFVMPYFARGSLATIIRPGQAMDAVTVLDIARQVAEGLAFAHRHGIIHRDLKPANILIGSDGAGCCLADFGLARSLFNDTIIDVERDQLEGTAPYMSPGVAAGHAEDTRCDIYSFGALLYEMLTGEPPYAGRGASDVRAQILAGPPKPILERNPSADPGLTAVAEGAMARELRDRYADMADLLADLERIRTGRTVVGPRGLAGRVKRSPAAFWVPTGIAMIAVGLWLLWPPTERKSAHPPVAVLPQPLTNATPPKPLPAAPSPAPVPPVITPTPTIETSALGHVVVWAGQPSTPGTADGSLEVARFHSPGGIAVDTHGTLYVADTGNDTIREITADGTVTTLAGQPGHSGSRDGKGAGATFLAPLGLAVDQQGNVYVAEFANDIIRKISPAGEVVTLAGSAGSPGQDDAKGDNAHFRNPWSVAADRWGNLYVADRNNFVIRQVTPDGLVVTFAGFAGLAGKNNGPGTYARFRDPRSVAVDPSGDVFVADAGNGMRRVTRAGVVTTPTWNKGSLLNAQCVTFDPAGNMFIFDGIAVHKLAPGGTMKALPEAVLKPGSGARLSPSGMAADLVGNLYLVDMGRHAVWKVAQPDHLRAQR
jgi:serine/threonine protein kinase/sugar lactone lactonase YvrE